MNNNGNEQIFSPRWNGNVGINYQLPISSDWKGSFTLDYQYQSEVFFDPENTLTQEAYGLLNGRIVVGNKNLELAIWAQNLTDQVYLSYANAIGGFTVASYGLPRLYGMTVTTKF